MSRVICFVFCLCSLTSSISAQSATREAVTGKKGMVVAVCPIATQVGVDTLRAGGNAVDAAVAVAFAEAVTWPEAGNVGGGGFMLVVPAAGREPTFFDYREMAPAAATESMLARGLDFHTHKVSGVPGTVRGLELAHKRLGRKPWKDLVLPAVKLATEGFPVDGPLARRLNSVLFDGKTRNEEFKRVYGKNAGKDRWQAGDTLRLPDLGKTLRLIAEQGSAGFYEGENAKRLEEEMKQGGGLITAADLKAYVARERSPVRGTYRGHDVISAPPPSSGGTAIVESLNILEQFEVAKHPRQSAATIHLLAETMRRAFADRARHLGDPDFVEIPKHLTSKDYAKKLAASIDLQKATKSESVAPEIALRDEGESTTHFSIIDGEGMAVANTYTLENSFGNRIVVRGAGYILNNEMTDFNHKPGITTRTGLIGTPANLVKPGKRMLSSMTPTILAKNGRTVLVTGSPGGRTIINTVLCNIVNIVDFEMPPQQAVDEFRQHMQWFPDRIQLEKASSRKDLVEQLQAMGHTVINSTSQGDGHTIWIDEKGIRHGAADRRLNGKAIAE